VFATSGAIGFYERSPWLKPEARWPFRESVLPLATVRLLRVPASLRPKTSTASGTLATLGGAVALGGVGVVLRVLGLAPVFALIAAISTISALAFALAVARERRSARSDAVGVPTT
jgi:hypothetical protein